MPSVRIRDNMQLEPNEYRVKIRGASVASGSIYPTLLMAMDSGLAHGQLDGFRTKEPAFGLPATWIDESLREEATFRGYTIVDPSTVLTTHLTEILKENMADLLTYAEVQKLLREMGTEEKKLVEELIPSVVTVTMSSTSWLQTRKVSFPTTRTAAPSAKSPTLSKVTT
jgi:flagellar biosynthesis protein FlhA